MALPYLNHKQGKPWDFCFYPPILSSSSLPTALPVLPFCHPIDLTEVFTICQWRMPAGGAPNPLSGRTTVSTLFFFTQLYAEGGRKRKQTEATGEPRSAAFESGLWKTKHNKLLLKKPAIVSITYRVVINIAFKLLNTVIFAKSLVDFVTTTCYNAILA